MYSPWPTVPASSIARIEIGGTPSRSTPAFWARHTDGHPWVSIADMQTSEIRSTNERITDAGVRGSNVKPVPAGTTLMSFKLTVGKVAVAGCNLFTNEAIAAFHVDRSAVRPRWLVHVLPRAVKRAITDAAIKGATLNKKKLAALPIDLPPLPEQRRIAEILDALDEAIRKTEQVIAKLQQMKQGLLHDLLTRGIDENGELRDPERHPEQFKDSPLGRIPREWEVRPLASTALPGRQGFQDGDWIEAPYITSSGIRLIQTGNVGVGEFLDKANSKKFISASSFRQLGCKWVHPGDILICRLADPIGRACIVPSVLGASVTAVDCTIYRADPTVAEPSYVITWLNSDKHLKAAQDIAGGSTRQRISRSNLGSLPLPLAPLAEQQSMCRLLFGMQARIRGEHMDLHKLRTLKQGLMDDLLTGRVRVPIPEEAAA